MKKITLAAVNKAVTAKYPGVELVKGKGYFYISPIHFNSEVALQISGLYTTSIPVYSLQQQSIEQWVDNVRRLMEQPEQFGDTIK